jgi:hydroxymethylglutaryl-CoA synthase
MRLVELVGGAALGAAAAAAYVYYSRRAKVTSREHAARARPPNVGILAMECYFPKNYLKQTALEEADGCAGKYTVGLGQESLAYFDDREDVASILLSALVRLLESYGITPDQVGRLEVGTETLIDKSKSVKTTLLGTLFGAHADVEGVTSTNACYGGTAALLNSVAWVESSAWDGRYAVVVCGDIAVYEKGPARPTGGGGAVAMLIGPDAPLAIVGPRCTHAVEVRPTRALRCGQCALLRPLRTIRSLRRAPRRRSRRVARRSQVYDFYKPRGDTEYAMVDGKLSQAAYLTAVDECWAGLKSKLNAAAGETGLVLPNSSLDGFDYACMHSPYNKLVQKGFARLLYSDLVDEPTCAKPAHTRSRHTRARASSTASAAPASPRPPRRALRAPPRCRWWR